MNMKKTYETPAVEKIEFQFKDQVVVASGDDICEKYDIYHLQKGHVDDHGEEECDVITMHKHFNAWPCDIPTPWSV